MGGTSIWMSRLGPHPSTAGLPEWNGRENNTHQARCWVLRERLRRTFGPGPHLSSHDVRRGHRPYLENCTVDASILLVFGPANYLCAIERSNRIAKVDLWSSY